MGERDAEFAERILRLEMVQKNEHKSMQEDIQKLQLTLMDLSSVLNKTIGQMDHVSELFLLFHKLSEKIEKSEAKRDQEHKEMMDALSKKLDAGAPGKWAVNFQKIVQWIVWFIMILGVFGVGNWVQATLIAH